MLTLSVNDHTTVIIEILEQPVYLHSHPPKYRVIQEESALLWEMIV